MLGARRWTELSLVVIGLACQRVPKPEARRSPEAEGVKALLAPPRAGRFECRGEVCTQPYPRRPDAGEWRCADGNGVVWCAGGEPAAGVPEGPPDPAYRCGRRFGSAERICLDTQPDEPPSSTGPYRCSFAQERGMTRICRRAVTPTAPALHPRALPACWLAKDCPSGSCDRGTCRCEDDSQCEQGSCQDGVCAEAP